MCHPCAVCRVPCAIRGGAWIVLTKMVYLCKIYHTISLWTTKKLAHAHPAGSPVAKLNPTLEYHLCKTHRHWGTPLQKFFGFMQPDPSSQANSISPHSTPFERWRGNEWYIWIHNKIALSQTFPTDTRISLSFFIAKPTYSLVVSARFHICIHWR